MIIMIGGAPCSGKSTLTKKVISGLGSAVNVEPMKLFNCQKHNDILVVEGQGSLFHPAYSGVTLSLLHGSQPDAMIFCHQPTRMQVARHTIKFPTLNEMISQYETLVHPIKPAKIIGVSLNTFDLTFDQSLEVVELVEAETGLPTTDVIRFGSEKLVNSIIDVSKKKDLLNASPCT